MTNYVIDRMSMAKTEDPRGRICEINANVEKISTRGLDNVPDVVTSHVLGALHYVACGRVILV